MMELAFLAADPTDYYTQSAKANEQMGEALQNIRARAGALCRRIESTNHTIRRDLAYQLPE